MSNIDTISELLLHANTDYRIFDMARGIRPVESQTFLEIENGSIPAPFPRQQHAWFGILFFNRQQSQNQYIWFVKLPIDEQGLVIPAGRQQFLHIVVEALGQGLNSKSNPNNQLPENPFTFIPNQHQLADFNSICRASLKQPVSSHFTSMATYLESPQNNDWQTVSVQGIADFATSVTSGHSQQIFFDKFAQLAPEIQHALCSSFENHAIPAQISTLLIEWFAADKCNLAKLQTTLRALCQGQDRQQTSVFIHSVLDTTFASEPNILMLIAARHWQLLKEESLLKRFIEQLANTDNDIFIGLYSDLVQIPEIRENLLGVLRWPEKSPQLTLAIGNLFGQPTT